MAALSTVAILSRRTAALALVLAGLCVHGEAFAQIAPSEYDLKAAFVFQFLSYVTWPESKRTAGPLRIGVVGAAELVENLEMLARNQGGDAREIEVRALPPDADPRELHVLFVDARTGAAGMALLQTAAEGGVLTITEQLPRPADALINFEVIDSRVRFDVALGFARRNGFDISARLLQVALRVIDP